MPKRAFKRMNQRQILQTGSMRRKYYFDLIIVLEQISIRNIMEKGRKYLSKGSKDSIFIGQYRRNKVPFRTGEATFDKFQDSRAKIDSVVIP